MSQTTTPDDRMILRYDRLAPFYDQLHRRWLRYAGGEAQAALEAAVRMALAPESELLDAGCGTGRFARTLLAEGVAPRLITLLDPSDAMLARCQDIPVQTRRGRLEALPFAAAQFDIVTCAWALETLARPEDALSDLCRVLRPGGVLCLTFCADKAACSLTQRLMQRGLTLRGTGRFLQVAQITQALRTLMPCEVRITPCAGPAATLIARRHPVRLHSQRPGAEGQCQAPPCPPFFSKGVER